MTVNFDLGKTEALVIYRGKKALQEKQNLLRPDGSRGINIPVGSPSTSVFLNVVDGYKHLGSWVDSAGSLVPDATKRSRSAMSSYVPLSLKIFGSQMLATSLKIRLGFALVVSKLVSFEAKP